MVTIEKVNSVQDSVKNHWGQEQVTKDNGEVIHGAVSDTNVRMSFKLSLWTGQRVFFLNNDM